MSGITLLEGHVDTVSYSAEDTATLNAKFMERFALEATASQLWDLQTIVRERETTWAAHKKSLEAYDAADKKMREEAKAARAVLDAASIEVLTAEIAANPTLITKYNVLWSGKFMAHADTLEEVNVYMENSNIGGTIYCTEEFKHDMDTIHHAVREIYHKVDDVISRVECVPCGKCTTFVHWTACYPDVRCWICGNTPV
jgi:hypothetical protein